MDLDAWQADVLEVALGERADGTWAAREVGLICPRQNGKGSILEALELAALFLFDEKLILHSAHEFKTAADGFRRIWTLIEQTPDLDRRVTKKLQNNNEMSIEIVGGRRLRFVARTSGSGRGFSADRVVLDEAYNLPDKAISALLYAMSAKANGQIWYTSSAPLPDSNSDVLRRLCKRGRAGSSTLAYFEFCADPDCQLDDRDAWHDANPALGILRPDGSGITHEAIEVELGSSLPADFARERLGIWVDDIDQADRIIPADRWAECLSPDHKPDGNLAYALDVSPDGRSAAVATSDGTHIEVVKHQPGMAWVVDACLAKKDRFAELVLDPAGPAGALVSPLEAAGLTVRQVTAREHAQACGGLLDAVNDKTLVHIGQPELDAAAAGANRRTVGDAWLWSRRSSRVDISPLVAVTLARWAAGNSEGPSVYESKGLVGV